MWISRKYFNFLKHKAEQNINAECQILTAKENQKREVARAMEEYSAVLKERDELRLRVIELEHKLKNKLIDLTNQDIHPCRDCSTGWGSISSEGCHSCDETCERLKEYNERYGK